MTRKEKQQIRAHWAHYYRVWFKKDGTVHAQRTPASAWGVIYTTSQLQSHLDTLRQSK